MIDSFPERSAAIGAKSTRNVQRNVSNKERYTFIENGWLGQCRISTIPSEMSKRRAVASSGMDLSTTKSARMLIKGAKSTSWFRLPE